MEKRKCRRIVNHLLAEIIDDILYNLPVKSLLRFKCVSKSWRSSISSKRFAREHLKKSNSGTDFSHHNLLFRSQHQSERVIPESDYLPVERFMNPRTVGSCCIGSLLSDNADDDYESNRNCLGSNQSIPIPASQENGDIHLLGSCNGLILISINRRELYLWNPSTRKAKNIINASFRQQTGFASFDPKKTWGNILRRGLGYNELTDDYKVVFTFHGASSQRGEYLTFMYSSRTDSWKKIRSFARVPMGYGPAEFVNGRLHWLTRDEEGIHRNIVSLDLVDEKYRIMAPPPHDVYSHYDRESRHLAEFGGYLSFICHKCINQNWYQNRYTMDVWVMKKESWSKICTFSDQVGGRFPMPIWLKKNGDLVGRTGSDLVVYRGEDKLHQSRVDNMPNYSQLGSIVYVESLAAPVSDDK